MSPFAIFTFNSYVLREESQKKNSVNEAWSVKCFSEIMKKTILINHSPVGFSKPTEADSNVFEPKSNFSSK